MALAAASFLLAAHLPCVADPTIHYAPSENLEHIDEAQSEIDLVAYVLPDWPVLQAPTRAADRGFTISIYLDGARAPPRSHSFRLKLRVIFTSDADGPGRSTPDAPQDRSAWPG
jgi:phosphatidylserine/phosphatidylglycerophosphate/cardiolipin synthase-like enzyme